MHVNVGTVQIRNSSSGKLLFIKIDFKLNFKDHIGSICRKDSSKLNALLIRNWGSMDPDKRRFIVNAFVSSEFVYRPLAGMFYSREFCHQIKGLHVTRKMSSCNLPWYDFFIWQNTAERQFCFNRLRKDRSLGHKILRVYKRKYSKTMTRSFHWASFWIVTLNANVISQQGYLKVFIMVQNR